MSNQIIAISESIRPSKEIPFYTGDKESHDRYFKENYLDTGKCLSRSSVVSEDFLGVRFTSIWASNEDRLAFKADPVILAWLTLQTEHRKNNNISHRWVNREIDNSEVITREWTGEHWIEE